MSCHDSEVTAGSAPADEDLVIVISSYRPPESILALVSELKWLGPIVVSDDASPAPFDNLLRAIAHAGAVVVRHETSQGVARALNTGVAEAITRRARWLLTLDQDSWLSLSDARELHLSAEQQQPRLMGRLGVIGPGRVEVAGSYSLYSNSECRLQSVPEVIQSGSLWSTAALAEIGPFREDLAMDAIDAEACLRLRENGYAVLIDRKVALKHELGKATVGRFLGKEFLVTRHDADRLAMMRINRMKLFRREFKQSPANAVRTVRRAVVNEAFSRVSAWVRR